MTALLDIKGLTIDIARDTARRGWWTASTLR